jgi:solute carrier family 25 (peroxisomal adenine nucleotide transporter), member 17
MTIETAPPMAHAVGGSLGSALALLLLYPLERARVEMQTMTASDSTADEDEKGSDLNLLQEIDHHNSLKLPNTSRGGGTAVTQLPPKIHAISTSSSEESQSWDSCLNRSEDAEEVSSPSSSQNRPTTTTSAKLATRHHKISLLACIYRLHQKNQLYRGVTPVVTTMAASNFVFFYVHSFLKQWLFKLPQNQNPQQATLRLSLLASTLAGICNVLLTNPMWVANLRIVTSESKNNDHTQPPNNNLWKEMKSIAETEGWTHLWNGTPASLLLVSNPVIQFVAYEQLKNRLLQILRRNPSAALKPLEAFLLGALAKAISTVMTYPLQLAQTVLRVQKQEGPNSQQPKPPQESTSDTERPKTTGPTSNTPQHHPIPQQYRGTLDCLVKVYQRKGLEGWFAGMRTKLLQTVLTAAFTFLTYEQIIRAIMAVHKALQDGRRVRHGRAPIP